MSESEGEKQMAEDPTTEQEPSPTVQRTEQAVQQAQQFHDIIDQAKNWSSDASEELTEMAAAASSEEEAEKLREVRGIVKSVRRRIEDGDNKRARQL